MSTDQTFIESLSEIATKMQFERIPDEVRKQARLCILDTIGCMLAGRDDPDVQLLHRIEAKDHAPQEAYSIIESGLIDAISAMRINGYAGDILEMNDLIGGHASIGNVTACLAVAQLLEANGTALIESVVRGIEITARVYSAIYSNLKPYTEVGISCVGVPASIGVAAATSSLLGLNKLQTAHAMAIGASLANWCPAEVIFGSGGKIKPLMFGSLPAENGWRGAMYAQHGMTGPLRILESPIGYFPTISNAIETQRLMSAPDDWYLLHPRRKLHACCGYIHSALDLLWLLREKHHGLKDVQTIEIGLPAYIIPVISKNYLPASSSEARFHAEYCLALVAGGATAVIGKDHSTKFQSYLDQAEIKKWMQRIVIHESPSLSHYHQCTITLRDSHGRILEQDMNSTPKGSANNPLTDHEVIEKFRANVPANLNESILPYMEKILTLESFEHCDWVIGDVARSQ